MIGNPLLLGGGDYEISRSVRLRSSASASFSRTPASATNRRSWTWSGWLKRGAISGNYGIFSAKQVKDDITGLYIGSTDKLTFIDRPSGVTNVLLQTEMVLRDPSAWYHIVLQADTPNATSSDRVKIFVNGVRVTAFSLSTLPSQNYEIAYINNTQDHRIGAFQDNTAQNLDGYLTEINFIDGQALTPSSFGESNSTTGVWQPKKYTGTYGTNGFYLNFSDNSNNTAATIGKDYSGNGNNWTPNNISVTSGATYDSMLDVPTPWADGGNGRGNYAVLNPLITGNVITTQDANLTAYLAGGSNAYFTSVSSFAITTGKWYWEFTQTGRDASAGQWFQCGIVSSTATYTNNAIGFSGNLSSAYAYYNDGGKAGNGTATAGYGATFTTFDVIGIAFDADNGTITFYKNGVSQGQAFSGISSALAWYPVIQMYRSAATFQSAVINFGQRPFAYTPPSGFKALNTLNLPEPTIKKGNLYFDATLYSGNNANPRSITGLSFQPDLVWVKQRTANGGGFTAHQLYDAVRGTQNLLRSNTTDAELSNPANGGVQSFNADGFTIQGSSASINMNNTGETYVGWQWKEGATPGFDIVTYTGTGVARTVAHSLGVVPAMMIVKRRTTAGGDWDVYHSALGATKRAFLNTTAAAQTTSVAWNDTAPTSSVFTVGTGADVNQNGDTHVAYLFSEVAGFSRFGSYTGNGSTDGPFVFCGFRPRWVMFKRTDAVEGWYIYDTARTTINVMGAELRADSSAAESDFSSRDFLSNGFKVRTANGSVNASGGTYIFAAFAEVPFRSALAR